MLRCCNCVERSAERECRLRQEKAEWLQEDMKAQVDAGQLTAAEQAMLLDQARTRHAEVVSKLAEAEKEGQAKKVAKLSTALEALTLRQEKLRAVEPIKHKLKHQVRCSPCPSLPASLYLGLSLCVELSVSECDEKAAERACLGGCVVRSGAADEDGEDPGTAGRVGGGCGRVRCTHSHQRKTNS